MALNYSLKKGVLLQAFGDAAKACTNDSPHFTDELAEWYLKNQPGCEKYFERMPGKVPVYTIPARPPKQGGPTIIIPPERPVVPTIIVEPEKVEEKAQVIAPDMLIAAVTGAVTEPVKTVPKTVTKTVSKKKAAATKNRK